MHKARVSVIIPAFNEAGTIIQILNDVLSQRTHNFTLETIMVIIDGCTDATAEKVRGLQHPLIQLKEHAERRGKAFRLNEHIPELRSDLTVEIDADTTLAHSTVLEELIEPFYEDARIGITCGNYRALPAKNTMQKIAGISLDMFNSLKDALGEKALRYRCVGRLLCIRTNLAQNIKIPGDVATDVFTFFSAIEQEYNVVYCPKALTYYCLVETLPDFLKQNRRYQKDNVRKYFPALYSKYTTITLLVKIKWFMRACFSSQYSLYTLLLVAVLHQVSYAASLTYQRGPLWPISTTTKKLTEHHVI